MKRLKNSFISQSLKAPTNVDNDQKMGFIETIQDDIELFQLSNFDIIWCYALIQTTNHKYILLTLINNCKIIL